MEICYQGSFKPLIFAQRKKGSRGKKTSQLATKKNKSRRDTKKIADNMKLKLFPFISSTLSWLRIFSSFFFDMKKVTCEKIKMENSNEGFKDEMGYGSQRKKSICEIKKKVTAMCKKHKNRMCRLTMCFC